MMPSSSLISCDHCLARSSGGLRFFGVCDAVDVLSEAFDSYSGAFAGSIEFTHWYGESSNVDGDNNM